MARWIDADAIDYRNDKLIDKSVEFLNGVIYMATRIGEAPSIDIVRCKECRWWLKNLTEDDEDEAYLHCPIEDGKPDDFCSYGERAEQTEPKFDKDINVRSKDEPQTDCLTCRYNSDEWDSPKCDGCSKAHNNYEQMTDCSWK